MTYLGIAFGIYFVGSWLAVFTAYKKGKDIRLEENCRVSVNQLSVMFDHYIGKTGDKLYFLDTTSPELEIEKIRIRSMHIEINEHKQINVVYRVGDESYRKTCLTLKEAKKEVRHGEIIRYDVNTQTEKVWDVIPSSKTEGLVFKTESEALDHKDRLLIGRMSNFSKALEAYVR